VTPASTLVIATCVVSYAQQEESKRPSPAEQAQCKLSDGKTITVDYSSPRMKGRKIFDGLVPYGEVWRTGANEATTFVTNENLLMVKGPNVPAGSYTIFTVPDPGPKSSPYPRFTRNCNHRYRLKRLEASSIA